MLQEKTQNPIFLLIFPLFQKNYKNTENDLHIITIIVRARLTLLGWFFFHIFVPASLLNFVLLRITVF
jgi:hypothetical protein